MSLCSFIALIIKLDVLDFSLPLIFHLQSFRSPAGPSFRMHLQSESSWPPCSKPPLCLDYSAG